MDGDGAAEVVVVNDLPGWTEIRGDGSMTQVRGPALDSPRRLAVGDFDGDGFDEILAPTNEAEPALAVLRRCE